MKTTGLDSATSIPEGAVLSRAFWAVPDGYTTGQVCSSREQALEFALIEARRRGNTSVTVDLRWKLTFPGGGGLETVVQRFHYDDLASAQEHLGRIRFYADGLGDESC